VGHMAHVDIADAFGQEEPLHLAERLHLVDALVRLPDDGRAGALVDRAPDRESEGDPLVAGDLEVGPVAHAHFLDLVEEVVRGVAGEVVDHARLHTVAEQCELAGTNELLVVVELDLVGPGPFVTVGQWLGVLAHGCVEVVHAGLQGGLEHVDVGPDGQEVANDVDAVLRGQRGHGATVRGVHLCRRESLRAEPPRSLFGAAQVLIGQDHALEEVARRVAPGRDGRDGLADSSGTDDECSHAPFLVPVRVRRGPPARDGGLCALHSSTLRARRQQTILRKS